MSFFYSKGVCLVKLSGEVPYQPFSDPPVYSILPFLIYFTQISNPLLIRASRLFGTLEYFKEFYSKKVLVYGFWIFRNLYQKQKVISSLLYCNILTQGLASSFFLFLFKLRIAPFTEVRFKQFFLWIISVRLALLFHLHLILGSHLRVPP